MCGDDFLFLFVLGLFVRAVAVDDDAAVLLADLNPGFQEVVLVLRDGERKRPLRMPFKVEVSDDLLGKLRELVGNEAVKVN